MSHALCAAVASPPKGTGFAVSDQSCAAGGPLLSKAAPPEGSSALTRVRVQVERFQFRQKCIYIGIMLKRVINALHDASHFDDKDYYGALFHGCVRVRRRKRASADGVHAVRVCVLVSIVRA